MKKKTLRKLLIVFLILIIIFSAGIFCLNRFILPLKIKSLIIQRLEKETQKKVTLESVQFNIFKGLVLRKLVLHDGSKAIINLKEASCRFNILPFFIGKKIVIPAVRLESPIIFLERRANNTFNIWDLLPKNIAPKQEGKFDLLPDRITISDARIDFLDSYISPHFTKSIEGLSIHAFLSLPASIKFNLKAKIPAHTVTKLDADGEFILPEKKLMAKISISDLNPKEFLAYGLLINEGLIDVLINLTLKNDGLNADLEMKNRNLGFSRDKVIAKLNSNLKANLQYNLKNKQLAYSGNMDVIRLDIAGIEKIDNIDNISGLINFNQNGLSSERFKGEILGIECGIKLNLDDFKSPLLKLNFDADLNLSTLPKILADKFKITFPLDLNGKGKLKFNLETGFSAEQATKMEGVIDILTAEARLDKPKAQFTNINGLIEFDLNQLRWKKLNFDYAANTYSSKGILENFNEPNVILTIDSKELSSESNLKIKDNFINIALLKGKYLNSEFDLKGAVGISSSDSVPIKISATLNLNLPDIKKPLEKFKGILEKIQPEGMLITKLEINGNIKDWKSCDISAKFHSPSISAYGLSAQEFSLAYNQAGGLGDIPLMHLSLYDGIIDGNAQINLKTENMPYLLNAYIEGVKIEKLKLDTTAKNKDISGTVNAKVKLSGVFSDFSNPSGDGRIIVTDGKLWQLNLFKGLGQLLFTQDFVNIIFNRGNCDFLIKNKSILTDNLNLESNLVSLAGYSKIGFDSSLDGSINVQISNEIIPGSGGIQEITTAILGQVGRFAVVKITGTLQHPKYNIQPAVMDVIKGLKDLLTGAKAQ